MTRKPQTLISDTAQNNNEVDDNLVSLVDALQEIDENKPAAKLNEISIVDNKGGRIYF